MFSCPLKSFSVKPTFPLVSLALIGRLSHGQATYRVETCTVLALCLVCVRSEDRFPICRHRVPFDTSHDWSFETYLSVGII